MRKIFLIIIVTSFLTSPLFADVKQPDAAPGRVGNEATLKTPTKDYRVIYRFLDRSDLIISHDPITFQQNPDYPDGLQERQYHQDKRAQLRVIDQANNFDPTSIVNYTPTVTSLPSHFGWGWSPWLERMSWIVRAKVMMVDL